MADALFNTSYPSEAYKCRPTLPGIYTQSRCVCVSTISADAKILQYLLVSRHHVPCLNDYDVWQN